MTTDDRTLFDRALFDRALEAARLAAYPPGEFVGQESFMDASEILALGEAAGIGPGTRVLDVCCGVAGPGRLLAARTGCDYVGVDESALAIDLARARGVDLPAARFVVGRVPPLPPGRFDVVLLLETVLAFADKQALVEALVPALAPGGRLAITVEEGAPLTAWERDLMPAADTVWPWPLEDCLAELTARGLVVRCRAELTRAHRDRAARLLAAFEERRERLVLDLGEPAVAALCEAHRTWVEWLDAGRIRKLALVAQLSR